MPDRKTPIFTPFRADDPLPGSPPGRRHRRVSLERAIRFRLEDGIERRGQLANLSVRGAAVRAERAAIVGEAVTLDIPDLGQLKGRVAGIHDGGFGVALIGTSADRSHLANLMTQALNPGQSDRRSVRFCTSGDTALYTASGHVAYCELKDVSESGASVMTALFPAIGEKVRVGRKSGTVIRHHNRGIAIAFNRAKT